MRRSRRKKMSSLGYSGGGAYRGRFWGSREPHHEGRAASLARIVMAKDLSSMFTNNAIADAQAQTGAFSYFLGGEEWIEDTVREGDPMPVVAECYLHYPAPMSGPHLNSRRASRFF